MKHSLMSSDGCSVQGVTWSVQGVTWIHRLVGDSASRAPSDTDDETGRELITVSSGVDEIKSERGKSKSNAHVV